jgi:hypothetical protein
MKFKDLVLVLCGIVVFIGVFWLVFSLWMPASRRAKEWGGSLTVTLKPGEKFVNVTWKEPASLWFVTREAEPGEKPQTYHFREESKFGVLQGDVIIQEQAKQDQ